MSTPPTAATRPWPWLVLIATVYVLGTLFVWDFISAERLFYFWDSRFYHDRAIAAWTAFQDGVGAGLGWIWNLRNDDYNAFFTLPAAAAFEALNDSGRMVFIMTLVWLFVLPGIVVIAAIGRRAAPGAPTAALLATGAAALLITSQWDAPLRGYPDSGGQLALLIGILAVVVDPDLRRWRTVALFGLAVAAAVLFRRHFAYAVTATVAALVVEQVIWRLGQKDWRAGALWLGRLALAGILAAGIMLVVAPDLTWRAATQTYNLIYASYQRSPAEVLDYIGLRFGLVVPLLALAGHGLAWARGVIDRRLAVFLLALGAIWTLQWVLGVRQISQHYLLHALPLVFAVGLGVGGIALWRAARWGRIAAAGLAVLVLAQFLWAFQYRHLPLQTAHTIYFLPGLRDIMPTSQGPMIRHAQDYDTYLTLATDLRALAADGQQVFAIGSSLEFNPDVLRSADHRIAPTGPAVDYVLIPQVDSRDWLPLGGLATADLVLAPNRPLYHLPPDAHDVIRTALEAVTGDGALAPAFEPVAGPYVFTTKHGPFDVTVLARRHPITQAAFLAALADMRRDLGANMPYSQPPWLHLTADGLIGPGAQQLSGPHDGPVTLRVERQAGEDGHARYVHRDAITTPTRLTATVTATEGCPPVTLSANDQPLATPAPGATAPIDATVPAPADGHLVLDIAFTAPSPGFCRVEVIDLAEVF